MNIRKIEKSDCRNIAAAHMANLNSRFKGNAGYMMLTYYYMSLVTQKGGVGFIGTNEDNFCGFICGVWNPAQLTGELLRKFWLKLSIQGARLIINRPLILKSFAANLSTRNKSENSGYELRPIVVLPYYRGTNVATQLVDKLVKDCHERGFEKLFLFTEPQNVAANQFYKKYGFIQVGVELKNNQQLNKFEYLLS